MRNIYGLCITILVLCIACSPQSPKEIQEKERQEQVLAERKRVSKLMLSYIELVGDRYVLTLTEKEAKALGVSSELYYEALSDIDKANAMVRELQSDPNVVLELGDPQESIQADEENATELQTKEH